MLEQSLLGLLVMYAKRELMNDDALVFVEESVKISAEADNPWHILIVDDDEGIHTVTKLALDSVVINNRPLSFTSVYSAGEAKELLATRQDFCLVFLDVVMEHDQAGLEVVEYIRQVLENHMIRVIIRTGEPGAAPERMIIDNYDINDYKEKTELNVTRLYTSVRSSLLQYEQISNLYDYQYDLESVIEEKVKEMQVQEAALFESSKHAQMGELLSMIAHQWRQPLSRIGAVISQMQLGISLETMKTEEMTGLLGTAEDYVQNLSKIIKDFQNLYFPEENKNYLAVNSMIENSINLLADSLSEQGTKVDLNLNLEKVPELNIELKQVFMNIIKNAFDQIVKKQVTDGTIDIRVFNDEKSLYVEVEDNAGAEGDVLDQSLFEPYVSNAEEKHGKGLGLYVCKMIVEKHCKGKISVKPGTAGACFTVVLPLNDSESKTDIFV